MGALDRVILSYPSVLSVNLSELTDGKRSWAQMARTGEFESSRYGKFSITPEDLAQMLYNFQNVTPAAPTELPIDYDHLSMAPQKPGDGAAAGWMKQLELRAQGEELWAEVEWTPEGAERIAKKEYRFISPSFVKNHKHKDGSMIGATLLAAAVTNHPFLEGMAALTLYNFSAMGDLAHMAGHVARQVVNLSEVGQRVMIAPGQAHNTAQVGGTFEVVEVVGDGDNAFVAVKDAGGAVHKWFRATELLPASAMPNAPVPLEPPTEPVETPKQEAAEEEQEQQTGEEAAGPKTPQDGNERAIMEALEKIVATLVEPKGEGIDMSQTFTLRDDKGQDIVVTAEQLAKAGLHPVAATATVVENKTLADMQAGLATLQEEVKNLRADNATLAQESRRKDIAATLDAKVRAGFMTRPQRDGLFDQFKDAIDLSAFKAFVDTFNTRLVKLDEAVGHGDDDNSEDDAGKAASTEILELSQKLQREQGLSAREATLKAGMMLADKVEAYQGQFREQ